MEPEKPLEEFSIEELGQALQDGKISIEDLRENEKVRNRITRAVVKKDMEEHRDIYDRLAEV